MTNNKKYDKLSLLLLIIVFMESVNKQVSAHEEAKKSSNKPQIQFNKIDPAEVAKLITGKDTDKKEFYSVLSSITKMKMNAEAQKGEKKEEIAGKLEKLSTIISYAHFEDANKNSREKLNKQAEKIIQDLGNSYFKETATPTAKDTTPKTSKEKEKEKEKVVAPKPTTNNTSDKEKNTSSEVKNSGKVKKSKPNLTNETKPIDPKSTEKVSVDSSKEDKTQTYEGDKITKSKDGKAIIANDPKHIPDNTKNTQKSNPTATIVETDNKGNKTTKTADNTVLFTDGSLPTNSLEKNPPKNMPAQKTETTAPSSGNTETDRDKVKASPDKDVQKMTKEDAHTMES